MRYVVVGKLGFGPHAAGWAATSRRQDLGARAHAVSAEIEDHLSAQWVGDPGLRGSAQAVKGEELEMPVIHSARARSGTFRPRDRVSAPAIDDPCLRIEGVGSLQALRLVRADEDHLRHQARVSHIRVLETPGGTVGAVDAHQVVAKPVVAPNPLSRTIHPNLGDGPQAACQIRGRERTVRRARGCGVRQEPRDRSHVGFCVVVEELLAAIGEEDLNEATVAVVGRALRVTVIRAGRSGPAAPRVEGVHATVELVKRPTSAKPFEPAVFIAWNVVLVEAVDSDIR